MRVQVEDGEWVEWAAQVPRLDMETHRVTASDVVVPTTDTLRHVEVRQGLPWGGVGQGSETQGLFCTFNEDLQPPWSSSCPYEPLEPMLKSACVPYVGDVAQVLRAWLASHRPLILCGPPGSGKTMTLTSTLQVTHPDMHTS